MKINKILLVIILIFSLFISLYRISTLPISLFGDEVDVAYQSWSLATTGKDYMGNFLPTYVHSLTEWRAPLIMYVTAPFVLFMGPSAAAVRIPVALLGVLSVYLIYLFVLKLFNNERLALISSLFLSISPWHIHYSRASFEVNLQIVLLLLGLILLLSKRTTLAVVCFVLTFYTYSTSIVFVPLLILFIFLTDRKAIISQISLKPVVVGILLVLPIVYSIISGPASGRFGGISIFSDQKLIDSIIVTRTEPWVLNQKYESLFHNKFTLYLHEFTSNYLSSFSVNFLFLKGDPNFRHSIGTFGELPIFFAPLMLIGLYVVFKNIHNKSFKIVLSWLLVAPVASSLTQGGGSHATRLYVALPGLIAISSLGLDWLISQTPKKLLLPSLTLVVLISAIFVFNYWHDYSGHYRFLSERIWQNGFQQIFSATAKENIPGKIYINNTYEPSLLKFLLFTKFPPKEFQKEFKGDNTITDVVPGFSGFVFGDKYYFGEIKPGYGIEKLLGKGDAYIAAQMKEIPGNWDWSKNPPAGLKVLNSFHNSLGDPVLYLITKQ